MDDRLRRIRLLVAGLFAAVSFVACQPAPEERLEAAHDYVSAAEYRAAVLELKNVLLDQPSNSDARSLLATASYHLGDYAAASDEFSRALELGANLEKNWIGFSDSLLRLGRAVEAFERVAPNLENFESSESLRARGDILLSLGQFDDAKRDFQAALALDERSEPALIGLAVAHAGLDQHDSALEILTSVTEMANASARAWQVLGNYLQTRSDLDGAVAAYRTAIRRETRHTLMTDQFETRAALVLAAIEIPDVDGANDGLVELRALFPRHPVIRYLRGRIAFADGDTELAANELREYLTNQPNDLSAQAVMGAISFAQSHYSEAERYLEQAVRGDFGGESTRMLLAETQMRLNRPLDALDVLGEYRTADNLNAALLGVLGRAEFMAGNRGRGLGFLARSVEEDPSAAGDHLSYAAALLAEGDVPAALAALDAVPDNAAPGYGRELLIIAAHEQGQDRRAALRMLESLLAENSGDAAAHSIAGMYKMAIRENEEAGNHFADALRLDAQNATALLGVSRLALAGEDRASAESYLGRLLDSSPAHEPGLVLLGQLLLPEGRIAEYKVRLDSAMAADPYSVLPRLVRVHTSLLTNDPEEALTLVRPLRERNPELTEARYFEGLAYLMTGKVESAVINLQRAARQSPETPRYLYDLGLARTLLEDYVGAEEAFVRYRRLRADDPLGLSGYVNAAVKLGLFEKADSAIDTFDFGDEHEALLTVLRGDVALGRDQVEEAVAFFETAASTSWNRAVAVRLASAYLTAGKENAAEPLARWLADYPDDAAVRRLYGQVLQSSGDSRGAISSYEKALNVRPDDPIALNNLAWEYAASGREGALDLAQRAYQLRPEHGSIADTYGWILYGEGQYLEALAVLRKAAELSPNNLEIKYHLARALVETGGKDEALEIVTGLLASDVQFPSRDDARALAEAL